jgi:homoserine dehydrogenase
MVRQITLVQIGIGTVGGAVIEQVAANRDQWRSALGVDLQVGAVVTRAGAVVSASGGPLPDEVLLGMVRGRREGTTDAALTGAPIDVIAPLPAVERLTDAGPVVIVDASAGEDSVPLLVAGLNGGAGVVLANKAPMARPWDDTASQSLWAEARTGGRVRYEATCGAGLPIISTLWALLDTADEIVEIQGTVSGTFGTIFSDIAAGQSFGDAVRDASAHGYTEPDPRDDLSGLDVARKALILARTMGKTYDLSQMEIESLVPAALASTDIDVAAFLARIGEQDATISRMAGEATRAGGTLKYVITVSRDSVPTVGLRTVPQRGILGALHGPENVVVIRSGRYKEYPLAIFGPGAGADVTAAGVLADVLALVTVVA